MVRGDHAWGELTRYDGNRINWGARYMMEDAEVLLSDPHFGSERSGITVHQGSPSTSVGASAGTHSKRSVVDTSNFNYRNRVLVFRLGGAAAWYRPRTSRWIPHIHFVMCGDDGVHWLAARQVVDYWRTPPGSGLGSIGSQRDNGPKMYGARPLYVLPHRSYALNGKIECKVACHAYTRQTTAAPQYGPQIKVGEQLSGVFTTRDARTGKLWVVTKNGRCVYADNFKRAA
jgi:hypothetical protein